jgi:xanthine dehydrogenase YagS FAD-binding subunit
VLDAQVVLQNGRGERTVPLRDFFLLPGETPEKEHALVAGELITAVTLPPLPPGAHSWYVKLRDRASFEFALASAAVVLQSEGGRIREARVALGGVGTKPWRSPEAEAVLRGAPLLESTFRRAAEAAFERARPRAHNAFKIELGRRVITRALTLAAAGQPAVRSL